MAVNKKKLICRILLIILLLLSVWIVYMVIIGFQLTVADYTVKTKVSNSIRIVQLSDLHDRTYGKDNSKLIKKVAEQNPDIIFMTGDMISKDTHDFTNLKRLIIQAKDIAPVYFGLGNHECQWIKSNGNDLIEQIEQSGAVILENEYIDTEINGNIIRIGGHSGFYGTPHMVSNDENYQNEFWKFQKSFEDTDDLKILLSHIPTTWVDWKYIDEYDVDIVFSGHYHGGEVKVPFVGGLYAPYIGFFPKYTEGVFYGKKSICVLSTGLGSNYGIRFNNPPQIVVADLVSENQE